MIKNLSEFHLVLVAIVLPLLALQSTFLGSNRIIADTIKPSEFETVEGLEVTLWATTPQLYNPTNFDFDGQGRMWVTEAVSYRHFANPKLPMHSDQGDRVVVLTDTDGDGSADQSHTFVRDPDLLAPLGIAVIDNRIVVSCSPKLLVYTDVDRDAKFDPKVDKKEVYLTGFGGRDHDHSLHSVTVGPDGWWYFNVGNAGPHTVKDRAGWTLRAGSSYGGGNVAGRKSDDGRVWVGGVALRMRPDGTGLQPIGHNFRNSYEQTVTSFGDVFQNDNDDPPACRTTWLMEFGNAGFSSADGKRSWRQDQRPGQTTRVAEWRQEDPGVMPAGDIYGDGAPTGIAYYENGALDSQYPSGLLLSCESARGVVFGYVPETQGAGFSLQRFDFLKLKANSANGGWFRPSDVAVGPDGAIYVSDWFDPGVGGHRMNDRTGSGSIYRIAPKTFRSKVPKIDLSTAEGSIQALCNPSPNVRSQGFFKLQQLGTNALPQVKQLLQNANRFLAARAVWLLPSLGDEGVQLAKTFLQAEPENSVSPELKIATIRSLKRAGVSFAEHFQSLSKDPSVAVRRELALVLRDVPWSQKKELVTNLASGFDGWDRWYLEAMGIACEGNEAEAFSLLVGESDPMKWDRPAAQLAWRLHPPAAVAGLKLRAMNPELTLPQRKQMIDAIGFVSTKAANEAMLEIATRGPDDLRAHASWWGRNAGNHQWREFKLASKFPPAPKVKSDRHGEGRPRIMFGPTGDSVAQSEILHPSNPSATIDVDVRGANRIYLIAESTRLPDAQPVKESGQLLANWVNPQFQLQDQSTSEVSQWNWLYATRKGKSDVPRIGVNANRQPVKVAEEVVSNSIGVTTKSVIAFDLQGQSVQRFRSEVRFDQNNTAKAHGVRFSVKLDRTPSAETIAQPQQLELGNANAAHGQALFFSDKLACARCHMIQGYGGEIGPDLTQIAAKHATPVLMESILRPSAAISMGFETMDVATVDGKLFSGLLISNGDPLVLKDAQGKYSSISRDDIDAQQQAQASLMPEMKGLLTVQETRDLVAFLKQVAKVQ